MLAKGIVPVCSPIVSVRRMPGVGKRYCFGVFA